MRHSFVVACLGVTALVSACGIDATSADSLASIGAAASDPGLSSIPPEKGYGSVEPLDVIHGPNSCTRLCSASVPCSTRCENLAGVPTTCQNYSCNDKDGDGVLYPVDNCPSVANAGQTDCD